MVSINPYGDALRGLIDVYAARRKAEVDLDVARAKESFEARDAFPNVIAQVQERQMKEAKRREQIAKQGAAQQAPARAMIPQTVDVTGQTGGRDMQGSLKTVAELAGQMISRGGPQPAGQQPGMPGAALPRPGMGPAINPSAGPVAAQAQQSGAPNQVPIQPQAAQVPAGGSLQQQGTPGSVVEVTRDLPWWEQALYIGGGLATRSPGLAAIGIRGKETIGTRQIPTIDEQAESLAPGLSVLIARSNSTDPATSQAAQAELDKRREQIRTQLSPDIESSAYRQGEDLWLIRDEQRRIREEDPLEKTRRQKAELEFGIEDKVAQNGLESLTPGERAVFERGRRGVTIGPTTVNIEKSTKGSIEKELSQVQQITTLLDQYDEAFFAEGYELMSPADEFQLTLRDREGQLDPSEKNRLTRYQDQRTAIAALNVNTILRIAGKQQSVGEISNLEDLLIKLKKGATRSKAISAQIREQNGLAAFRYETIIESGSIADPRYAMSIGNTKNAARTAFVKRLEDLQGQGLSEAEAAQQARQDFKNRYGLDVDRLMGK